MSAQPTTTEMVTTTPELRIAPAISGLEPDSATALRSAFETMFADADRWIASAAAIRVTSVDQKREMRLARESRLALREIRIKAEHARKRLKEDSTRRGKAIDGIANVLKALIEPIEAQLLEAETFAERAEEARKDALRSAREEALRAHGADPSVYADLGEASEETWSVLISDAQSAHEAKREAARQAEAVRVEAERIAAEARAKAKAEAARLEAERLERERVQAEELERAKAEAAAVTAAAEAERQKAAAELAAAEARVAAERAAAEATAAELAATRIAQAEAEAEAERVRLAAETARHEAERLTAREREADAAARAAAERAPDREKLAAFAATVRGIPIPKLSTERGQLAARALEQQLEKFAAWIERTGASL